MKDYYAFIPTTWQQILEIRNEYRLNHRVKIHPTSTLFLDSFIFPLKVVKNLSDKGAHEVYFAFNYHETQNSGAMRKGISIIIVGIDNQNRLMLSSNDIIWDANIIADPNQVLRNISLQEMKSTISAFMNNHISTFKTIYELDGEEIIANLKGMRIPISEMKLFEGRENEVRDIECIIGYHTTTSDDLNKQKGHTFGIIGRDEHERLRNTGLNPGDNDVSLDKAFDFCEPCPTKCPENEQALWE